MATTMTFLRTMRPRLTAMLACALLTVVASQGLHAALDTTALTDDHSINTRTEWWTYTNQTPQQLSDKLAEHSARIVGLDVTAVTNTGEPRFTARLVPNSGAYAVPGWGWYYDQSPEQITTLINANTARIVELERYDRGGGQIRYAVVMVSNTGAARRNWSYLMGVTRGQLGNHISASGHRPIDLDVYGSGNARRYNAVLVANTGSDQRGFDWDTGQSPTQIAARSNAFNGRVVKLGRDSDGNYLFVQVKNTGSNASGWWHQYGFTSITELENYAHQMRARPVDVVSFGTTSGQRFAATMIDNANDDERRLRSRMSSLWDGSDRPRGIFSVYLKQVAGPARIELNAYRRAETASAFKVVHLLHAMRQVQLNLDALASDNFKYWNYYDGSDNEEKDRCPDGSPIGGARTITLEEGLDRMMKDSDNRTTRGVVYRYGGFDPINATAAWAGLSSTTLRHNIGCGYTNLSAGLYTPQLLRNDTTAADLASIYEGVWRNQLLSATNGARREFLESTSAGPGAGGLFALIQQEATAIGRLSIAEPFSALVKRWGKGGTYDGLCLGTPSDASVCGESVFVRASAGLIELPVMNGGFLGARRYAYSSLISDMPSAQKNSIISDYDVVRYEMFRSVIREALRTW